MYHSRSHLYLSIVVELKIQYLHEDAMQMHNALHTYNILSTFEHILKFLLDTICLAFDIFQETYETLLCGDHVIRI